MGRLRAALVTVFVFFAIVNHGSQGYQGWGIPTHADNSEVSDTIHKGQWLNFGERTRSLRCTYFQC